MVLKDLGLRIPDQYRLDPVDSSMFIIETIYVEKSWGIWPTLLEIHDSQDQLILTTQDYNIALFSEDCPNSDC